MKTEIGKVIRHINKHRPKIIVETNIGEILVNISNDDFVNLNSGNIVQLTYNSTVVQRKGNFYQVHTAESIKNLAI